MKSKIALVRRRIVPRTKRWAEERLGSGLEGGVAMTTVGVVVAVVGGSGT